MKLLLSCAIVAVVLVSASVLTTIFCVLRDCGTATIPAINIAGAFLWPGLVLMGTFYHKLGLVGVDSLFAYVTSLVPGILVNVFIYTMVLFVLVKFGWAVVARGTKCPGISASN